MKSIFTVLLSLFIASSISQETLLLGEQKLEEIYFTPRADQVEKVSIYSSKYKKKGNYKDSTLKGIENYDKHGFLTAKTSYSGKGAKMSYSQYSYEYHNENMVAYRFIYTSASGNFGRSGNFEYLPNGKLKLQEHSMANIKYGYFSDGRLKTKTYFYNNGDVEDTEPWIHYYIYDDSLNLIHVDTEKDSKKQTSFYDDNNNLIKHDYYPGFAYTTYTYDKKGNCIGQIDYEQGKKDWDSTIFKYEYNENGQIIKSSSSNKKGKIEINETFTYDAKGRLKSLIYFRKNKAKVIKKYVYQKFKE